jgi:hypothetical protein
MIASRLRQIAAAIASLSTRILPPAMRQWGIAMQYEVEVIDRTGRAMSFAIGCLGFALQQAFIFRVLRPLIFMAGAGAHTRQEAIMLNIRNNLFQHPRRMVAFI